MIDRIEWVGFTSLISQRQPWSPTPNSWEWVSAYCPPQKTDKNLFFLSIVLSQKNLKAPLSRLRIFHLKASLIRVVF